jgi:hypothetical protein
MIGFARNEYQCHQTVTPRQSRYSYRTMLLPKYTMKVPDSGSSTVMPLRSGKRQLVLSLWLHGIPGCGKTVLTSTIIEHFRQDTTCQVLLYFYFDSSDTDKRSLNSLLRSLITQLCRELPEALQPVYQLWVSLSGGPKQPSTDFLQSALRSLLSEVNDCGCPNCCVWGMAKDSGSSMLREMQIRN